VDADTRTVVPAHGRGELRNLDFLSAEVALADVREGDAVIVRANYHPAWTADVRGRGVPLYDSGGQLAFRAPADGTYVVRLAYPRYRALNATAAVASIAGAVLLAAVP
jgi:hypothetical protein